MDDKTTKALKTAIFLLLTIGVSGLSFYFGQKSKNDRQTYPVVVPEPLISQHSEEPSLKITPSPKITKAPKNTIITSEKHLDGFRSSNFVGNSQIEIKIGRNINAVNRGFLSFDISDIPPDAEIVEAKLRIYQVKVVGKPYTANELKIDHLTYGNTLDTLDYGLPALTSGFSSISINPKVEYKEAIVTSYIRDDLANARSRSQFRLHFQVERKGGDEQGDFAFFESADDTLSTGNTPQLIVQTY